MMSNWNWVRIQNCANNSELPTQKFASIINAPKKPMRRWKLLNWCLKFQLQVYHHKILNMWPQLRKNDITGWLLMVEANFCVDNSELLAFVLVHSCQFWHKHVYQTITVVINVNLTIKYATIKFYVGYQPDKQITNSHSVLD